MVNVRVFQLARGLKLSSQEVIDRLKKLGIDVKTASSSVDEDTADKLKRALKIDALASRKRRIYGSEEDEAERELEEKERENRIAAERAERERAAEEARLAAEARKAAKVRGPRRGVGARRRTKGRRRGPRGPRRRSRRPRCSTLRARRGSRRRWPTPPLRSRSRTSPRRSPRRPKTKRSR